MKHVLFVLLVALSTAAFGQGQVYTAPYTFSGPLKIGGSFSFGSEIASTHLYSITCTKPVVYISTTRLDTIRINRAKMKTGQKISFVTTSSTNDSTLIYPDAGNINGAASYWFTGAAGTYKSASVVCDGTNFYIIK